MKKTDVNMIEKMIPKQVLGPAKQLLAEYEDTLKNGKESGSAGVGKIIISGNLEGIITNCSIDESFLFPNNKDLLGELITNAISDFNKKSLASAQKAYDKYVNGVTELYRQHGLLPEQRNVSQQYFDEGALENGFGIVGGNDSGKLN